MLIDHNARKKYLQVMGDKFLVDILIYQLFNEGVDCLNTFLTNHKMDL